MAITDVCSDYLWFLFVTVTEQPACPSGKWSEAKGAHTVMGEAVCWHHKWLLGPPREAEEDPTCRSWGCGWDFLPLWMMGSSPGHFSLKTHSSRWMQLLKTKWNKTPFPFRECVRAKILVHRRSRRGLRLSCTRAGQHPPLGHDVVHYRCLSTANRHPICISSDAEKHQLSRAHIYVNILYYLGNAEGFVYTLDYVKA